MVSLLNNLMDQYVLKLGLKSDDYLFPRFAKSSTSVMTVCKVPIGYGNARDELHRVLSELSLPQVSLHSERASAATYGVQRPAWRSPPSGMGVVGREVVC